MMSSVIPARLQFQCGHAALVTLPRVKGESSAQRNARIAREKSAALSRQCDFCGPAVQVALSAPDEMNGSHMLAAELTAPEVEAVVVEPVAVVEEPIIMVEEPGVMLEEPIVVFEEPAEIVEEPVVTFEEPVTLVEEPVIIVEEEPVVVIAEILPERVRARRETARTNGKVVVKPARQRRAALAKREVDTSGSVQRRHFVVEYRTERVLNAADIHDALRQAAALGAINVLAATRE